VAPVRNAAAAVEDPQVAALELVDELEGIRFTRTPLSQFARRPLAPAQRLGADSAAVLTEALGKDADEVRELLEARVIEVPERPSTPSPGAVAGGAAHASST
jgi:crotonobetainyl-CoA:carnitine CoA-transferase CaiB-like acyl-CoA transferase